MRPLKAFVWKAWCIWNGHKPVAGTYYSVAYGKHLPCVCCEHCRAIL